MNDVYRLVWNCSLRVLQVTSEFARASRGAALLLACLGSTIAQAGVFNVGTEAELVAAINAVNNNGDTSNTINLTASIALTGPLPTLGLRNAAGTPLATNPLIINGQGKAIDGGNAHRIFFVNAGVVTIENVTLADGRAAGGNGGTGWQGESGGGGMGAGGALFVRGADAGAGTGASVTLSSVTFASNDAIGGKGGNDPVPNSMSNLAAGGGGLGGHGDGAAAGAAGIGGGGGAFEGQNAISGAGGGLYGGAPRGGAGGDLSGGGGSELVNVQHPGGAGGFAGGGGGRDRLSEPQPGGAGGFGGGGGGSLTDAGGAGGYGGGGGAVGDGVPGAGGFAGGRGGSGFASSGGGGGGALGGAIFVAQGGSLTIVGTGTVSGGAVTAGLAGSTGLDGVPPQNGQAAGTGLFLQGSGTVTFAPASGQTIVIADAITDEAGFLAANPSYTPPSGFSAGSWGLTKSAGGTLVLTGANAYAGGTTINSGTLQVGNGGTTGSLGTAGVTNNASLVFNRSDTVTVGNAISGTGSVSQSGSGTLILMGANTYAGATRINSGTLQVDAGGTDGTLGDGDVINNGSLVFTRPDHFSVFNLISGSGNVSQSGTGTLLFTRSNTYSGTTTINSGILQVGYGSTEGSLGSGDVTNNGLLLFSRSDSITVRNAIGGTGEVWQSGPATLVLAGTNSYSGTTKINIGTLQVGDGGAVGTGPNGDGPLAHSAHHRSG